MHSFNNNFDHQNKISRSVPHSMKNIENHYGNKVSLADKSFESNLENANGNNSSESADTVNTRIAAEESTTADSLTDYIVVNNEADTVAYNGDNLSILNHNGECVRILNHIDGDKNLNPESNDEDAIENAYNNSEDNGGPNTSSGPTSGSARVEPFSRPVVEPLYSKRTQPTPLNSSCPTPVYGEHFPKVGLSNSFNK